ncbi:hypothetical protein N0V87_007438 [Didymella glomerata]|uniref:DUF4360 domain-containing protein n=1 Tax=Didymella glomerata TaxID=749621 RepID=A0A9W9BX41_9PLEO|nr:hypothetical protein N0V87_007438 [Didymella glomerata]
MLAVSAVAFALPQSASTPPPSFKITNVVSGDFGKEFVATVGPKADITDSRKFCQLNLELSYSAGYSFAVYNAEYAGFADLDPGVTGTIKSNYYFSGETDQTSSATTLTGPARLSFKKQDGVDVAVWSPCSGSALFNVDASVALTPLAGSASGVLGVAKESGRLSSNLYIAWKKCEQK